MRLKIASLAILGAAAIGISALASPAMAEGKTAKGTMAKGAVAEGTTAKSATAKGSMAEGTTAKGTKAKGTMAKGAKYAQAKTMGSQKLAKGQRHATYSKRIRNANAALLPNERVYRRPAGPAQAAGNVVGGAVATAGAIATAPFQAFDNRYSNYYGYGYGGRDWKTYAAHNSLACTPGTTFKGPDGKKHPCQ